MSWISTRAFAAASAAFISISAQPPAEPPVQLARARAVGQEIAGDPVPDLLRDARRGYLGVRDYTCTFVKQERVGGELRPAQTAELAVQDRPFAVNMKFVAPRAVRDREAVYVGGMDTFRVRESGWKGAVGFVTLKLDDPRVQCECRHTIKNAGVGALTEKIARLYVAESPSVSAANFRVGDRECTRVEMTPDPRVPEPYAAKYAVYFDRQTSLPVRFEAFGGEGELLEMYDYSDIRLNVGVDQAVFRK